jgi:hypothetical protein
MTPEDALEMEARYDQALQDRNEYEEELGASFREAEQRAIFDWEGDLPEHFFF